MSEGPDSCSEGSGWLNGLVPLNTEPTSSGSLSMVLESRGPVSFSPDDDMRQLNKNKLNPRCNLRRTGRERSGEGSSLLTSGHDLELSSILVSPDKLPD